MVSILFTVYDVKAEFYMPTQTAPTMAMATRMFLEAAQDVRSNICKYPDDFVLFKLGSYDDHNATFDLLVSKESIGSARDLMSANNIDFQLPATNIAELPITQQINSAIGGK